MATLKATCARETCCSDIECSYNCNEITVVVRRWPTKKYLQCLGLCLKGGLVGRANEVGVWS